MPDVRLVDLPVIVRYSLAVRQESAPAEELLAALDESREIVLAATRAGGRRPQRRGAQASKDPAPATPVSARLTPRPPGGRNPVRALAALPKDEPRPASRKGRTS